MKYVVETVSMFRMRYVVDTATPDFARMYVENRLDSGETAPTEFSQKFLDEVTTDVRPITDEEYLTMFNTDNDYLQDWSTEEKMQFVNYDTDVPVAAQMPLPFDEEEQEYGYGV
mgnify:FL=1